MLARDRFAVELGRDQDVVVEAIGQAHVRAVAVVAGEKNMFHFGFWPNEIDEGKEGDARPAAVELAPGGDAVKIAHVCELGERVELLPGERLWLFHQAANFEPPFA